MFIFFLSFKFKLLYIDCQAWVGQKRLNHTASQPHRVQKSVMLILVLVLVLVLKDALRTIFEVLVLVLESQVLVLVLMV